MLEKYLVNIKTLEDLLSCATGVCTIVLLASVSGSGLCGVFNATVRE